MHTGNWDTNRDKVQPFLQAVHSRKEWRENKCKSRVTCDRGAQGIQQESGSGIGSPEHSEGKRI